MRFEKVSIVQWKKDLPVDVAEDIAEQWYENIKLPERGTKYSAGYDFFAPYTFQMPPQSTILIPTGITWVTEKTDKDKVLLCMPRSGMGFKYGIRLMNTVGVIDADYCESSNEGHIMMRLYNPSEDIVTIPSGKGFIQGIITRYCLIENDTVTTQRDGGMGSTDR